MKEIFFNLGLRLTQGLNDSVDSIMHQTYSGKSQNTKEWGIQKKKKESSFSEN